MTVTDRDMGYDAVVKLMRSAGISADIGVFSGDVDNEGGSIAEYASANEYGTSKIPSRPFMRTAFDESEKEAYTKIRDSIRSGILNKSYSIKKSVGVGAEFLRASIVLKIKSAAAWAERNADSTIALKGMNRPLVMHGIMWKAMHTRIERSL